MNNFFSKKSKVIMKKILFLFLILVSCAFCFGFGGKAPVSISGHIKFYGNAPFEYPGIETVDRRLYAVQVEENSGISLKEIEETQGKLIELTGRVEKKEKRSIYSLRDGIFVASELKILE